MSRRINTSIPDEMGEFIDEEGFSPAELLQSKIREKMDKMEATA